MRRLFVLIAALMAAGSMAFAQTGDPYIDAAAAIVASPKPAAEVMQIIDSGRVDVNHYYSDGMTLMHYAAVSGRADLMPGLIERGGRLDIPRNQADRATPVSLAKAPGLVAYLKSIGAVAPVGAKAPTPAPKSAQNKQPPAPKSPQKKQSSTQATAPESSRREMCNGRHYSSSALCSDSTCKAREYRKWQTCLQTGSYY